MAYCSGLRYCAPPPPTPRRPPPRAGVRVENRPEDVLRAQAIMRNILLALLALCFGAATTMEAMFQYASSFNQDLGWCVANKVKLVEAFNDAKCESTSCGVVHVADVADCPTPARKYPRRDDWLLWLLRAF